jgi:DNA modification methylase
MEKYKMIRNEFIYGDTFTKLSHIKDQTFDLVLTDVPYDFKQPDKEWLHNQFLRVAKGAIVFSPPENQWILPANQYLFWIKPISTKNTRKSYSRFVEMIFLYGDLKWNPGRHWSQYTNVFTDLVDNSSMHPYRKPPSLIERLIRNHSDEGDYIFDPFAGSGVVHEMCITLRRNSLSIELAKNGEYKL